VSEFVEGASSSGFRVVCTKCNLTQQNLISVPFFPLTPEMISLLQVLWELGGRCVRPPIKLKKARTYNGLALEPVFQTSRGGLTDAAAVGVCVCARCASVLFLFAHTPPR
jgi:hypothetical protein